MLHAKVSTETRKELRKAAQERTKAEQRKVSMGELVNDLALSCNPETIEIVADGSRKVSHWVRLVISQEALNNIGDIRVINDVRSEDVLASLLAEVR